jgi:hypothetical protein
MATPRLHPRSPAPRSRPARLLRALAALLALALIGSLPLLVPSDGQAAPPLLGDADVHVDSGESEINVALSQTQNTCGGPALNGQFCVRYSVEQQERSVAAGYGVVPASAVRRSGAGITLTLNTASAAAFHVLSGPGGVLSIHWTAAPGASPVRAHGRTSRLARATVGGSVLGHPLKGALVQTDVLSYP